MPYIFVSWCSAWPKTDYIKTPSVFLRRGGRETQNTERLFQRRLEGETPPRSPPDTSPTSLTSTPSTTPWRGSSLPLDYGFVAVACSIYLLCFNVKCHMSWPTWLWCILCNSYVMDLYFIRWSMRCDMLLCSWCMSRCILLLYFFYLFWSNMYARGGWCVLDGLTM
jgi:hypothetical protein